MFTVYRFIHTPVEFVIATQRLVALFLVSVVIAGCSGSSGSSSQSDTVASQSAAAETDNNTVLEDALSQGETDTGLVTSEGNATDNANNTTDTTTSRVTFEITVPVYASNALQVRLAWGDKNLNTSWVMDESWSITDDFSTQAQHPLTISFSDNNGAITLATYTAEFKPDSVASQTYVVTADQFDSNSWDTDQDGVSNLAESIAGTNPQGDDVPAQVQPALELIPDKTFRLTWSASPQAQFYRVLENPDGVSGFTQLGNDLVALELAYDHRVALYNRVNASYIVQACNDLGCSDSTAQSVPDSLEDAITYVKGSNTEALDLLGVAVALTSDGNMLAIGARNEDSASTEINGDQRNNEAGGAGAVYIFERVDDAWQQQAYIKASNAQAGDGFGSSIGLSADGTTLAVGAPGEASWVADLDDNSSGHDSDYGAVYIFTRSNGSWFQNAYLKPGNPSYRTSFGGVLSLSADGNTLAVGVAYESSGLRSINGDISNGGFAYRSGAAYIFVRAGDGWVQQAHIKASNAQGGQTNQDGELYGGDYFGNAVSISGDGNTLAVGAPSEASSATGIDGENNNLAESSGAVYTFTRTGESWQQQAYIKASNAERRDYFGGRVSLDGIGNTLVVYASGEDSSATGINGDQTDNSADGSGALYLFSQSSGSWQQQAYIKADNAETKLFYLTSRSLSDNGKLLVAGNMVYVYRDASWQSQLNLQSVSGSEKVYNGSAVVSGDGNTIAIGDPNDESSATGLNGDRYDYFADRSGAVYLY